MRDRPLRPASRARRPRLRARAPSGQARYSGPRSRRGARRRREAARRPPRARPGGGSSLVHLRPPWRPRGTRRRGRRTSVAGRGDPGRPARPAPSPRALHRHRGGRGSRPRKDGRPRGRSRARAAPDRSRSAPRRARGGDRSPRWTIRWRFPASRGPRGHRAAVATARARRRAPRGGQWAAAERRSRVELGHLPPDALAGGLVHRGRRRGGRPPAPAAHGEAHQHQAQGQAHEGNDPHEEIEAVAGRREQDPRAVLLHEVRGDLLRGLARGEPLADDGAHLIGGFRRRVGHREALAHHAAEIGRHVTHLVLGHRSPGRRGAERGHRDDREARQEENPSRHDFSASRRSTCVRTISSETAPTLRSRIRPARSMKKVSGTP